MKNFCDKVSFVYFLDSHIKWYFFSLAGYGVFQGEAVAEPGIWTNRQSFPSSWCICKNPQKIQLIE